MRLVEIRRYPVKSLRGHSLTEAIAERAGLAGDRRWMIVDQSGKFLTQRQHPKLAQIEAVPTEDGLELRHAAHGALDVRYPNAWRAGTEGRRLARYCARAYRDQRHRLSVRVSRPAGSTRASA